MSRRRRQRDNWHGCCFVPFRSLIEDFPKDVSSRTRAAPQAATHFDTPPAAVREAVAAVGAGMCARTEPSHCAKSFPGGTAGGARLTHGGGGRLRDREIGRASC